ncbi:MAG: pyridoxal-phosphate dependent enzyme [Phycisphaerales bacterium]
MTERTPPIPTPDELFRRVMLARPRVYRLGARTPIDAAPLPGGGRVLLKREDLGPVHSFKWRGAAVKMSELHDAGCTHVVAASAGNHAQGVAVAAAAYGVRATIFMPRSTPRIKQAAVERFGGSLVEIRLDGDTYDASAAAAACHADRTGATVVHAYDDPSVIAGQGVIADEIIQDAIGFDRVYLPIGGGGLAAGVACVLRAHRPDVEIVGVEAEGQASMAAASRAANPPTSGPSTPSATAPPSDAPEPTPTPSAATSSTASSPSPTTRSAPPSSTPGRSSVSSPSPRARSASPPPSAKRATAPPRSPSSPAPTSTS